MSEAQPDDTENGGKTDVPEAGWHRVAASQAVTGDALLSLTFADLELVAYRDPTGEAHIASAKCPHNDVDLNCTSAPIQDGVIACPLHQWNFDTRTGWCTLIPYNPAKLPKIRLTEYPAHEEDGAVLLWWDPAGGEPPDRTAPA